MYIGMEPIYSTLIIKGYGNILTDSQNSTDSRIHLWLIIMVSYIHFHLTCIHLIKCGVLLHQMKHVR